jgi:hypothetical protein
LGILSIYLEKIKTKIQSNLCKCKCVWMGEGWRVEGCWIMCLFLNFSNFKNNFFLSKNNFCLFVIFAYKQSATLSLSLSLFCVLFLSEGLYRHSFIHFDFLQGKGNWNTHKKTKDWEETLMCLFLFFELLNGKNNFFFLQFITRVNIDLSIFKKKKRTRLNVIYLK